VPRYTIERMQPREDFRGVVLEPVGTETLAGQQNVYVAFTVPGGVRGNHYHEHGTEIMTVFGPALVRLRDGDQLEDVRAATGEALRITIPPGVGHAVRNTGEAAMVIVSFNTAPHDHDNPDVVRDMLLA
jgi:oxalate decarboxylase/phosphoglucose isomerase-like protein (cupin superfamily)